VTIRNGDDQHRGYAVSPSLPDPRSLIEDTHWASLQHAYGPAADTPLRLVQLLDESPEVQAEALGQLDMSVLHQGSLYSATPQAALFIAAILDDPHTAAQHQSLFPWDDRCRPLRAALLEWLGQVADSAAYGEASKDGDDDDDDEPGVTDACRAIRPVLWEAVSAFLDDPNPAVREAALGASGALLKAPDLGNRIPEAAQHVRRILADSKDRRERAAAVLTIGAWDQDITDLLTDADPAIRACAALASSNTGNNQATEVILQALSQPAAADSWFSEPLPQFDGWFRFTLLAAAMERTATFEELLPAALALVPLASDYTVDRDWGPLLIKAFPQGFTSAADLTTAQRCFLDALVSNDACWGNIANKSRWLREAGLPERRTEIRSLLEQVR